MHISELFLETALEEATRWKELASKLSHSAMRTIQKTSHKADPLYVKELVKKGEHQAAKESSKNKGIVKPFKKWLDGFDKGVKNKIEKNGFKTSHKMGDESTKDISHYSKSYAVKDPKSGNISVHIPDSNKTTSKNRYLSKLTKNHEADEAIAIKRMSGSYAHGPVSAGGSHQSNKVLKNEKKIDDYVGKVYGHKAGQKSTMNDELTYARHHARKGNMKEAGKHLEKIGLPKDAPKEKILDPRLKSHTMRQHRNSILPKETQSEYDRVKNLSNKDIRKQEKESIKKSYGLSDSYMLDFFDDLLE